MSYTIVVLADIHAAERNPAHCPDRRSTLAEVLLLRAVHRINRTIKPNITLLLGDLIDDGASAQAPAALQRLRGILDVLQSPLIVIPGNHDGDVAAFYRAMPRPAETVDIDGVRFLPFLDQEAPHYNAQRTAADLARMTAARVGFDGPIVALQHVPLLPPGQGASPYRVTNADAALQAMRTAGITLAISGHFHDGDALIRSDAGAFVVAPALCEAPFAFLEITIDGEEITVTRHTLRLPSHLGLIDCHTHTPFAYCQENMDFGLSLQVAEAFGLAGLTFTEHSGQMYFAQQTYWRGAFLAGEIATQDVRNLRMPAYLAAARQLCPPARLGLELDCDAAGQPVVRPEDQGQVALLIGAVHHLRELDNPQPDLERAADEFLARLQTFIPSGIQILAHPFRVFRRAQLPVPERLFAPTVRLLREHGVAAEINFHTNEPSPAFTTRCLEAGVKLTFGSDAHNLYEIGEFTPHLALLRQCGITGDLHDVLSPLGIRSEQAAALRQKL
ncbi:MAG TPA: metallophosphoesterase [Armatimonadota bacterium]|jgi:histidinol phosphatase-like PHP family hydrolase/predicted phosphodiesterase